MKIVFSLLCLILFFLPLVGQERWQTSVAEASFKSDAPLELIEAKSNKLRGILDTKQKRFAFSIPIQSFQGFNSPLQREHFNENYLESNRYPNATFSGKVIGELNLSQSGEQNFRAKGELTIHGVTQERIIKVTGQVSDGRFIVRSSFTILLEEHGIAIPRIVYQKIAEEIAIEVEAIFESML